MKFSILILCLLLIVSCKKETTKPTAEIPTSLKSGLLVLNEGMFQFNNAKLSWMNNADQSVNNDFFEQKNNRSLGDTGNDLKRYGGKIYVVVSTSSTIEILNATTGKSIKQISMMNGSTPKQPRSIAFYGSSAFVTCYDGFVDVFDTTNLTITMRIPVGQNPEDLVVSNHKLYVSNSGGLNFPNVDSTVSVINLNTLQEIKRITVGPNPGAIVCDAEGDIYVISRGNYAAIPAQLHRIETFSDTKTHDFTFAIQSMAIFQDKLLISEPNSIVIKTFNTLSESNNLTNFITNAPITTLYGMYFSSITNKVYCFDAVNYSSTGYVVQFSASGNYEKKYHVGLNPSKLIVYE